MAGIGVYLCHCGHNIASVIDVEAICEEIARDPRVAVARTNVFCCAEPGQKQIQQDIEEAGIDRVLVAACSPRLHEPTFRRTIEAAGINRYLLEMANIREQCSWVHGPRQATEKALELVRMGISRLQHMVPLSDRLVPVTRRALVLGGGVAGMKAALELADMNVPVVLLEQDRRLGGQAARWACRAPGEDPLTCFVDPLVTRTLLHPLVEPRLGCRLQELRGYIGNFTAVIGAHDPEADTTVDQGKVLEEQVGAVVVAAGFEPYRPDQEPEKYPYSALPQVLTSVQLEEFIRDGRELVPPGKDGDGPRMVAFQQCVGSRDPRDYPHCSRICCAVTLKQALTLRRMGYGVIVYHRDIRLYHKDQEEQLYREARRQGVLFQRGTVRSVEATGSDALRISAEDEFLGLATRRVVDRLVLAVGLRPRRDIRQLRETLKLAKSEDGFFLEAHPKLQPLETSMDGIFLAGTCQGPKDVRETVSSSLGAASKAYQILSREQLRLDGMVASIDPELCVGCGKCAQECPYQAIEMVEGEEGKPKARVLVAACKGCGVCAGCCPTGAADHLGFLEQALGAQLEAALATGAGHKIIAYCCNWCAYAGADSAGVARLHYPSSVRIIRIPCSGRVNARLVLKAFQGGAARVLVAGCHPPGDCHYISGNLRFAERVPRIRKRLEKKGFDPAHFQLRWISATEGPLFQKAIEELARDIEPQPQLD